MTEEEKEDSVDPEWEKQVKDIFQVYDKNNSGNIPTTDLPDSIRSCGIRLTDEQLKQLKKEAELENNNNNLISFKQYRQILKKASQLEIRDSQIAHSFEMFIDDQGMIELDKFKHALMTLGDRLTKDEINTLLKDAGFDEKRDNSLHYSKILELIQHNVF